MVLSEYTVSRADKLNKMMIPEVTLPYPIKILWIRVLDSVQPTYEVFFGTHKHSFYEVHFVMDGSVCYDKEGDGTCVQAKQGLLIPPGTPHTPIKPSAPYTKCSIAFSIAEDTSLAEFLAAKSMQTFSAHDPLIDCINTILRQTEEDSSFSLPVIQGRVVEIIYMLSKAIGFDSSGTDLPKEPQDVRLAVAKAYIAKHENELLTCEDVARECGLSTKQLNRIFLKYTDKNLYDHILQVRLHRAEAFLLNSTLSIKEISIVMGFENQCSFSAFFKRHCGIPPGQFRKQNL